MAFPVESKKSWYLVKHDDLVKIVGESSTWLRSDSWTEKGWYSSAAPGQELMNALDEFKIGNLSP